ncbi:MAG: DUF2332 domain-containing protein [Solirubrobacteraceae bacterium]|jgi:hypothetical protein
MIGADPTQTLAESYRRFARGEANGKSALYEELCEGVADDPQMLDFLSQQPSAKRQPNLLLASVRVLFGLQSSYAAFRAVVLEHRDEVSAMLLTRRTQTNEPARCAALLPLLCELPQPLALLEVGAAAGLCLLADHYGYDYDGHRIGGDEVVFECSAHGDVPLPHQLPQVAWRAGIDLEPIDLDDRDAMQWLEALVWPEQTDRLERLRLAIGIARRERPRVVRANLLDALATVASEAPPDATLVVFHTAVLAYLSTEQRTRFETDVAAIGAEWISNEAPDVVPGLSAPTVKPVADSHFVIARNHHPVAFCDPHGRWVQWLARGGRDDDRDGIGSAPSADHDAVDRLQPDAGDRRARR